MTDIRLDRQVYAEVTAESTLLPAPGMTGGWKPPIAGGSIWRWQSPTLKVAEVYTLQLALPDEKAWTTQTPKTGFVLHHDGVNFPDLDKDFNGTTLDESLERIEVIWRYHRYTKKWNGIGYHAMGDPHGRLFIVSNVDRHRAHVKSRGDKLNHEKLGYCMLGAFTPQKRPTEAAIKTWQTWMQWVTNRLDRPMDLRPHVFYQSDTQCPGWATAISWEDQVYKPQAQQPPPPVPGTTPAPVPDIQAAEHHLKAARAEIELALQKLNA